MADKKATTKKTAPKKKVTKKATKKATKKTDPKTEIKAPSVASVGSPPPATETKVKSIKTDAPPQASAPKETKETKVPKVKTVKMSRGHAVDGSEIPAQTADVHPDEVENMKPYGWVESGEQE